VADGWRRRGDQIEEFLVVHASGGVFLARPPHDGARAGALALPPAVEHGSAGQDDRGGVDGRRRHDGRGRGLVAAGGEHDSIERITEQDLDKTQIGEIAIERRRGTLAGFLDRMHGELERDAAGVSNPVAHALRQFKVVTIAGREVGAGLGNADDRLAGVQFLLRQA
jgi:hypothetical protein